MSNHCCLLVEIEQCVQESIAWRQARENSQNAWKALAVTIREFVQFAKGQGCLSVNRYYTNVVVMIYQTLFQLDHPVSDYFRDSLTTTQNNDLAAAERIVQRALQEGMENRLPHKEVYRLACNRAFKFASMVGKTKPGDDQVIENTA